MLVVGLVVKYVADMLRDYGWILVFPTSDHRPPLISECLIGLSVSPPVVSDLRSPELGVPGRWPVMFRTAVPVAAVNEDRDLGLRKDDISSPP